MLNNLNNARQGDHVIVYAADGSIVGVGMIQSPTRWKHSVEVTSLDSLPGRGSIAGRFAKMGGFRACPAGESDIAIATKQPPEYIRNVEGNAEAWDMATRFLAEKWTEWAEADERKKEALLAARPEAVRLTEKLSHAFTCNGNKKLAAVPLELLRPLVAWMEANGIELE